MPDSNTAPSSRANIAFDFHRDFPGYGSARNPFPLARKNPGSRPDCARGRLVCQEKSLQLVVAGLRKVRTQFSHSIKRDRRGRTWGAEEAENLVVARHSARRHPDRGHILADEGSAFFPPVPPGRSRGPARRSGMGTHIRDGFRSLRCKNDCSVGYCGFGAPPAPPTLA